MAHLYDAEKSSLNGISYPNEDELDLPYIYWISKMHKIHINIDSLPVRPGAPTKPLSILLTKLLTHIKAILQVLIYKALFDKSYLGSKTTMISGEWTCLISFATAPLTCSERGGSEKFKMKICLQRDSNPHPASPRRESCSARPRWLDIKWSIIV